MTARHSIGYTTRGPVVFRNVRRSLTGEPLLFLDQYEVKNLELDFTNYIVGTETITSAAQVNTSSGTGDVVAVITVASPLVTIQFSGATSYYDGGITLAITFSDAQVYTTKIKVRRTNRFGDEDFNRDYTYA